MTPEALASFVCDRLDGPRDVCAAWMSRAQRTCGKPGEDWLCSAHFSVANRRVVKWLDREKAKGQRQQARADAYLAQHGLRLRQQLARVEAEIDLLDPPSAGPLDHGALNAPLRKRGLTDAKITRLVELHKQRDQLRLKLTGYSA